MNSKQVFATIGASALGITLIAVPGTSAIRQGQRPSASPQSKVQAPQAEVEMLPPCEQEPSVQVFDCIQDEDQGQHIVGLDSALASIVDDDDMQVVIGPGSSWLGVGVTEVTAEKVKELKLPAERGALLGKIVAESPAAKAGLKENDVVTEINGTRVEGTEQFRRMIREIPSGRTAQLTIWRDGRSQTIGVMLGKSENKHGMPMVRSTPGTFAFRMPDLPEVQELPDMGGMRNFTFSTSRRARLGIDAEDLDGDFGKYFGAPDGEGILVRNVFPDSPAAKAGLKAGDVITSFNG